jgi:hypothetical protein
MRNPRWRTVIVLLPLAVGCGDRLPTDHASRFPDEVLFSKHGGGAAHEHSIEAFPAYYNGSVVTVLMGPGGNSANPNQVPSPHCWGLGPDVSRAAQPRPLPALYALFVPGADQMPGCAEGDGFTHDMVLSALPGDPGFGARIDVIACGPDENFETADNMPYTSAADVEAAIANRELACGFLMVLVSPVIGARRN